ncbi:hypothetical protein ACFZCG_38835 [Streptomyces tanashiensis]|uniref:hypothetical protein n=1 Tax=Streptomyces tanashiensis TaxID=67367 RepID=UPI0036E7BB4E
MASPTPSGAAPDPPGQPPTPPRPGWYSRVDWTRHTTVFAAVAAAAGLAITGWGTLKAAQVADDQLAQSRERKEQAQWSVTDRVSAWGEGDSTVFANRSLYPAPAHVSVLVGPIGSTSVISDLAVGVIPPCTQVVVPNSAIVHIVIGKNDGRLLRRTENLIVRELDGTRWLRTQGQLWPVSGNHLRYVLDDATHGTFEKGVELVKAKGVKFEPLDPCGASD